MDDPKPKKVTITVNIETVTNEKLEAWGATSKRTKGQMIDWIVSLLPDEITTAQTISQPAQ